MSFRYTRRSRAASLLVFSYEWSADPGGPWTNFTPASEASDSGMPVETFTVVLPPALLGTPALFVRVKAAE